MTEAENYRRDDREHKINYGNFEEKKRKTELILIFSLISLITGVIFLTFDLKLLAGCLVIAGASLLLLSIRKYSYILRNLKDSIDEALSTIEKKDNVISDFSHKIREPLNNLVIISDLLSKTQLQKKQKELMETFVASTNNMVTRVNELTMKSAENLNYTSRKPIRFNIASTVQNTIDIYRLREKTGLDIIFNKKDFGEYYLEGDPVILKQIFLDIFSSVETNNSERITRVTLNLSKEVKNGKNELIFFRIQTDNNNLVIAEDGTSGMLASRLIKLCKGEYSQESGNSCTVLTFSLPFFYQPVRPRLEEPVKTSWSNDLQKAGKDLKTINVLVVEDDLINQRITLLALKPFVKGLETAANGLEAIEKLKAAKYDLILMDIQMPVLDGLETAEKIREMESGTTDHIPIIAITANAMLGDMEKCLAAGIDDYISKPYKPSDLIEKIGMVLDGSSV
jgi:CheY-like chemotaxis protein